MPWLWLALFFLVPFLIVFKISFATTQLAQPPYTPMLEWGEGVFPRLVLHTANYLGLLADSLRADGNPDASRYFDSTAVAELKNAALTSTRLDQSLAAIMTLDRAGTPAAIAALNDIAQHPADPACQAAAQQALKRHPAN